MNKYEKFNAEVTWELTDGSFIHSDKPIVYNQKLYYEMNNYRPIENYQCMPPITSLKKEIVLYPIWGNTPIWKIISPNATLNLIDNHNILTTKNIDVSTTIEIPYTDKGIWYVNSTKPVIALSQWGFSSRLDTDFIKTVPGKTMIAVIEDNTQINFDQNNDGVFDITETMNRGYKEIELIAGTRIKSNKNLKKAIYRLLEYLVRRCVFWIFQDIVC